MIILGLILLLVGFLLGISILWIIGVVLLLVGLVLMVAHVGGPVSGRWY
jgi:hypothetical protein